MIDVLDVKCSSNIPLLLQGLIINGEEGIHSMCMAKFKTVLLYQDKILSVWRHDNVSYMDVYCCRASNHSVDMGGTANTPK